MNQKPYEKTVLVLGDGDTALGLLEHLNENGFPVILSTPGPTRLTKTGPRGAEILVDSRIEKVSGQVGGFDVIISAGGREMERRVGFLAVACKPILRPYYDLEKGPGLDNIITATEAEDLLFGAGRFPSGIENVIILGDPRGDSTTASTERLFRLALELQRKRHIKCHLICSQVKVASRGLELFYGQVRNSGCLISKTEGKVEIDTSSDRPLVRFFDEVLYEDLSLTADMIIVGEHLLPSGELDHLSRILSLERGPTGFLQADNVLREPCFTNRRGIFVVGSGARPMSRWEREMSVGAASAEIHGLYSWLLHGDHPETIDYNRGNCAYCLTCYRVCPHGAVHFTTRPYFLNLACRQCGICISACPGEALHFIDPEKGSTKLPQGTHKGKGSQSIMAFVCRKSASVIFGNWDKRLSLIPTIKWVEVPCAGLVKMTDILDAFSAGDNIKGVLVLACHEGNCRSEKGTLTARKLVESAKEILSRIGGEKERIEYISTAPNDGLELVRKIENFWKSLGSGENPKA